MVTVSQFLTGQNPKDLEPEAPYTWVFDENAAKAVGSFWSDFRTQSIAFKTEYPETYEQFPSWDLPFEWVFRPFDRCMI